MNIHTVGNHIWGTGKPMINEVQSEFVEDYLKDMNAFNVILILDVEEIHNSLIHFGTDATATIIGNAVVKEFVDSMIKNKNWRGYRELTKGTMFASTFNK